MRVSSETVECGEMGWCRESVCNRPWKAISKYSSRIDRRDKSSYSRLRRCDDWHRVGHSDWYWRRRRDRRTRHWRCGSRCRS